IRAFHVTGVQTCALPISDISLAELRSAHDAVLIATGVYKSRELMGPGASAKGVHKAIDYLITSNRVGLGQKVDDFTSGRLDAKRSEERRVGKEGRGGGGR